MNFKETMTKKAQKFDDEKKAVPQKVKQKFMNDYRKCLERIYDKNLKVDPWTFFLFKKKALKPVLQDGKAVSHVSNLFPIEQQEQYFNQEIVSQGYSVYEVDIESMFNTKTKPVWKDDRKKTHIQYPGYFHPTLFWEWIRESCKKEIYIEDVKQVALEKQAKEIDKV